MKKVIVATIAVLSMGTASLASAEVRYDESTEKNLVNICKALKSNSRLDLNRAVRQARVTYRAIADDLVCNGLSAHEFALINDANETAGWLAKRANLDVNDMLVKR